MPRSSLRGVSSSESQSPRSQAQSTGWIWLNPLGTALIWGVNIPVMKSGLGHLHPFAFNALRLTLSAAVLFGITCFERRRPRTSTIPWVRVASVGLLGSFFYQVLFLGGMARTSAGHTALIIASQPLWTALLAAGLSAERHARTTWAGFGIAFCGTTLVVFRPDGAGAESITGNLMVLGAALTWALSTVLSRPLLEHLSPTRLALAFTLFALPFHWLLASRHLGPVLDGTLSADGWGSLAYSGALSTGLAYILWNRGVRALGASRTAIFANLVPVVALFAAWVYLAEVPGRLQLVGGALVLTGLLLSQRRPRPSTRPNG